MQGIAKRFHGYQTLTLIMSHLSYNYRLFSKCKDTSFCILYKLCIQIIEKRHRFPCSADDRMSTLLKFVFIWNHWGKSIQIGANMPYSSLIIRKTGFGRKQNSWILWIKNLVNTSLCFSPHLVRNRWHRRPGNAHSRCYWDQHGHTTTGCFRRHYRPRHRTRWFRYRHQMCQT